ncbi:MAG: MBL fold metallo-hydrolase [Candidatus Hodarchaeales archaeon]|jgi:glyoxylase-like metal-dependent hydrolase (beta-lactamase superfamily II)
MVTKTIFHSNGEVMEWRWASDHEIFPIPFWTSCYYIDGLLIDSGAPGGIEEFEDFLISIGIPNIKACLLTHTHEDHAGGAYLLREKYDIPVYASEKANTILETGFTYPLYREIAWGSEVHPVDAQLLPDRFYSKTKKYVLELLPMPGHAPDQVIFIERTKQWVFAADGIQMTYKRLFGKSSNISEDISVIYRSIKELYNFVIDMDNLKLFLTGKDVIYGSKFLLDRLTEIENLHQNVSELYQQGQTIEDIDKLIFKKEDFLDIHTNGELSRKNLIESLIKWEDFEN